MHFRLEQSTRDIGRKYKYCDRLSWEGDGTPGCGTQATLVDAPVLGGLVQVTITATGTPSKIGSANQTLVTLAPVVRHTLGHRK